MNVGIATMTRCPDNLFEWIQYHFDLGISKIYLRLEGPRLIETLKHLRAFPDVIVLESELYPEGDQMVRQIFLVHNAIEHARQHSIDFLLHIDDDELLHVKPSLQEVIRSMNYDNDYDYLHIDNVEAVYPVVRDNTTSCFQITNRFRDCTRSDCRSYGNGKSMARITRTTEPDGVHYFKGRKRHIPSDMARILHFESCDFEGWKQKFSMLPPSKFVFYRQSHDAVKRASECGSACDDELHRTYLRLTAMHDDDSILSLFPR